MLKQIAFLLLCLLASSQLPEDDEVDITVPGYTHTIYSGYLQISVAQGHSKSIHYVYFQSQDRVTTDPLIVSLAGGPGCSSLNAMLLATGPFVFKPGQHNLTLNKNAWNKRANLVYLELPAGVGFSWKQHDDAANDQVTIEEGTSALRTFFIRFPRLTKNDLYLTGTGYGAVFAALMAKQMIRQNEHESIFLDKFKIKGILLGNPCVKPGQCYVSEKHSLQHYEFLNKRGFLSKKLYNEFRNTCYVDEQSVFCFRARADIDTFFAKTQTSLYNVYDKCYFSNQTNTIETNCLDEEGIKHYLNQKLVQIEWNIINEDSQAQKWEPCDKQIFKEYLPNTTYVYDVLPHLIQNHQRIWIYSGDLDSNVPTISTKKWIGQFRAENGIPIKRNWREWWVPSGRHKHEDQVGGMIWELESLTFASVKGAGFRSAIDQPVAMEEVLNGFLDGKSLPEKNMQSEY